MRLNRLALALLLAAAPLAADENTPAAMEERLITATAGFLTAHPDISNRLEAGKAYQKGRYDEAATYLRRAARYADKSSQAILAELYWEGRGVAQDRALAYIWMDLAAERQYPLMIAKRESYWQRMDEAERARALEQGPAFYDEYGDDAAKPRLAAVIRRERGRLTGSRVGFKGFLEVQIPTAAGWQKVSGEDYYNDRYWEPDQYFQWRDSDWRDVTGGKVEVGEIFTPDAPPED